MAVLTLTLVVEVVVPPGPTAVSVYVVVWWGETPFWPEASTSPTSPLTLARTASEVVQLRLAVCPQLMLALSTVKLPILTGATTTVALAMPAWKRGRGAFFSSCLPRGQALVTCAPFLFNSMIIFWSAAILTLPDQTSVPFRVTVMLWVPGGTSSSWCQIQSKLNSSTWPTKYSGVLPSSKTASRSGPLNSMRPQGPATLSPYGSSLTSMFVVFLASMLTFCVCIL